MDCILIFGPCINCRTYMSYNADYVPSLVINDEREALCSGCYHRWNQIHRVSKGLDPVPLHPDAYQPTRGHDEM
jgi:hypothetical protein